MKIHILSVEISQHFFDDCFNVNADVVSALIYTTDEWGDYRYKEHTANNLGWYMKLNNTSKDLSASMQWIIAIRFYEY